MCGHRLKGHKDKGHACSEKNCSCKGFYYIPAEGSWMLRCRCKRKATEHSCVKPYKSIKPSLGGVICNGFDSPWVCNCGCPWANHVQWFEELRSWLSESYCMMSNPSDGLEVLDANATRGGFVDENGAPISARSKAHVSSSSSAADPLAMP